MNNLFNSKLKLLIIFSFLFLVGNSSPVIAQVNFRGFQVDYKTATEPYVASLKNEWNINIARVQIGDNAIMDFVDRDGYSRMMEVELQLLDNALALYAKYGISVIINLYSPPGGFQTRESPSHYRMFSSLQLQNDFISVWEALAARYKDNPAVYGFDLVNEPARRLELLCATCRDWPELASETFARIRQISPDKPILIKSLYGDPGELIKLPLIDDINVIYTYHAYPFNSYQSAGIGNSDVNQKRPKRRAIEAALARPLNRFGKKVKRAFRRKLVPYSKPALSVGEFAVSSCSTQKPERFLSDIIKIFEKNNNKKRRRRSASQRRRFKPFIQHIMWTNHALGDSKVWDPRFVCTVDGKFAQSAETARGNVLKKFLKRN